MLSFKTFPGFPLPAGLIFTSKKDQRMYRPKRSDKNNTPNKISAV